MNRALEAEEKIIMGKELSIAKRKAGIAENGGMMNNQENVHSCSIDVMLST